MSAFRQAGFISEHIWPLRLGTWSFKQNGVGEDGGKVWFDDVPARLLLLGLAVGIQAYQEIPSEWMRALLGLAGAEAL